MNCIEREGRPEEMPHEEVESAVARLPLSVVVIPMSMMPFLTVWMNVSSRP
jgi:hypothetical protein